MFKEILDKLFITNLKKYKEEVARKNMNDLNLFIKFGLFISAFNYFSQTIVIGNMGHETSFLFFIFFLMVFLIKIFFISKTYEGAREILYTMVSVVFLYSIMIGTIFDSEHQATTYFIFLVTMPLFILEKVVIHIIIECFWTAIFIAFSYFVKSEILFKYDLLHAVGFLAVAIVISIVVSNIRINELKKDYIQRYKDEHDSITKLYNRNHFERCTNKYVGKSLSLATIQINNLGEYYDKYGRKFNEKLVNYLASILKRYIEEENIYVFELGLILILWPDGTELDCYRDLNFVKAEFAEAKIEDYIVNPTFSTGYIYGKCNTVVDLEMMIRQSDTHRRKFKSDEEGFIFGGAYDRNLKYNN